jgi:hypothetical protein
MTHPTGLSSSLSLSNAEAEDDDEDEHDENENKILVAEQITGWAFSATCRRKCGPSGS